MSSETPPPLPRSVLCLGEALLDLVCERHLEDPTEADRFVPHAGGVAANVARMIAAAGVRVSLAGGAGDDVWGRWLARGLEDAGVDIRLFTLVEGAATPLAMVSVDTAGEATYALYGASPGALVPAFGSSLERAAIAIADAVAGHGALVLTSNTLVSGPERELTMAAREAALEHDRPIIFDPNLRLHRWSSRTDARASVNAVIPGVTLMHTNAAEAELLTGESDPERAAIALRKTGAASVVISLGAQGAMLRGRIRRDVPAPELGEIRSSVGAGDALTATLLAKFVGSGFYEPAMAAGLTDAVAAGARACERWGAVD